MEKSTEYAVNQPPFPTKSRKEWENMDIRKFQVSNSIDQNSAFEIKNAIKSFQMHLIYINQKDIKSDNLKGFLSSSIRIYNYFNDEGWENTLFLNKTKIDLILTLNKLKFEIKMSEFMTMKYLMAKLKE